MALRRTDEVGRVVDDFSGKVLDAEEAWIGGRFRLEQPAVVLVLQSDLLDVGLGRAASAALHVQHAQQTRTLLYPAIQQ